MIQRTRAERVAQAHTTLTEAEQHEVKVLRKNWTSFPEFVEPRPEPIYSASGDCGRKHMSPLVASACANIRSRAARQAPPAPSSPPASEPRSASAPAADPPPTESRRASILEAVGSSSTPLSANAIVAAVGGRRTVLLEEVRRLVRKGLLVATKGGFTARLR